MPRVCRNPVKSLLLFLNLGSLHAPAVAEAEFDSPQPRSYAPAAEAASTEGKQQSKKGTDD
jgi:hypothetical protein